MTKFKYSVFKIYANLKKMKQTIHQVAVFQVSSTSFLQMEMGKKTSTSSLNETGFEDANFIEKFKINLFFNLLGF